MKNNFSKAKFLFRWREGVPITTVFFKGILLPQKRSDKKYFRKTKSTFHIWIVNQLFCQEICSKVLKFFENKTIFERVACCWKNTVDIGTQPLSSKSSVRSTAVGHVGQNSSAHVARSVAAIWKLLLFKWSQLLSPIPVTDSNLAREASLTRS